MTHHFSTVIPWLGIMLCQCHVLYVREAAANSSSSLQASTHGETNHSHNATSTSEAALLSIFTKYGRNGSLSFDGFQHLLESLGLGNIALSNHNVSQDDGMKGSWSDAPAADHDHSQNHRHRHHRHDHDDELHVNNRNNIQRRHTSSPRCTDRLSTVVN